MEYRPLGDTGIEVSLLCLGTMSFGEQNTEAEAHAQLDCAFDHGVNFIDTAEMYAVPPCAETQGRTERYIGSWLAAGRVPRDRVVLATKVSGPGEFMAHLRGGPRLSAAHINQAVEASLRRLRTDYLDLYQVHWPERNTNYFGQLGYSWQEEADDVIPIAETYAALTRLVEAGKVRAIGISNETPWGALEYLRLARATGGPRIVSIQNPYSLLNRTFEVGLAEIAVREHCGLLAYSPLGFGVLSGKYLRGRRPKGARLTRWTYFTRYTNPQAVAATSRYVALSRQYDLTPSQMALAFINQQPFLTSNIIGATSIQQLEENLASAGIELPGELMHEIDQIHTAQPNPAP